MKKTTITAAVLAVAGIFVASSAFAEEGKLSQNPKPVVKKEKEVGGAPKAPRAGGEKEKAEARKPVVGGEIVKADGLSLILSAKGDGGAKEAAVTVSDKAAILVELDEVIATPGQQGGKQRKTVAGTLSDLKVGSRVSAAIEGGVAVRITVKYVPAPKKSGEGDKK